MDCREIFGKRLFDTMSEQNISAAELATRIGVSEKRVSAWIKGDSFPTLKQFFVLAGILHVSADYLLGLDNRRDD